MLDLRELSISRVSVPMCPLQWIDIDTVTPKDPLRLCPWVLQQRQNLYGLSLEIVILWRLELDL